MITIHTQDKMPPRDERKKRETKWPWASLAVGDFFEAEGVKPSSMRSLASKRGKESGRQFRVTNRGGRLFVQRTA